MVRQRHERGRRLRPIGRTRRLLRRTHNTGSIDMRLYIQRIVARSGRVVLPHPTTHGRHRTGTALLRRNIRVILMLAHVTHEVRLLRVGLPANSTDVSFDVLGLRVLGYVVAQPLLVAETLVARVTAVRLISHVRARVRLQVGQLREGLPAARMLTLVGFLARVSPHVLLKVAQLCELALADLALVGLDPGVDAVVLREIGGVGKALVARGALVRLGVLLVHVLAVEQQIRLALKDLEEDERRSV